MATNTPNLDLRQPAGTDFVNVLQDISNNMGKIDAAVGNLNDTTEHFKSLSQSVSDFNLCKEPGFYRGGSATLNTPVTGYYTLFVMPFSSGDLSQIAIEVNNRKMYFRTLHDTSTWTTWEEIALNSNVATKVTRRESYYSGSAGSHEFTLPNSTAFVLYIATYGADNKCAEYILMQGSSGTAHIHAIKTDTAYTVSASGNVVTVNSTALYWYASLIII